MNFLQEQTKIDRVQCWEIYHRLGELGIACQCPPLTIGVGDVGTAIQVWCVAKATLANRAAKIKFLERCWRLDSESQVD
ncbi:MAG: hypothetical protein RMK91_12545 [Pseudanabaenaceae cyanobacterium SKYGB_i_bin29]|nr:hypothetical protein [Pseudanabaenaceae cyanobacterium SKYG29]MDW8422683.1 hypothetical protein [Pseudanabaenaceae cyanobacterium SKYGB_i_bin29]